MTICIKWEVQESILWFIAQTAISYSVMHSIEFKLQ
jgi:hypothetical protein